MKVIHTSGKRKRSIARATLEEGKGIVRINGLKLENWHPGMYNLMVREALLLAGDTASSVDINVNVYGGGVSGQAQACRLAIARGLVEMKKDLEKTFLDYDRQLLVADVRRKETRKPARHGKARAKRQKSYR